MPCILLIDDDPAMERHLRGLLEAGGYLLRSAQCLDELSGRLGELPATNLVLLSLASRQFDSLGVLAQLRNLTPELKVFVLASPDESALVVEAIRLGATGFIMKPLRDEQLLGSVREALAGAAPLEEPEIVEELDDESFFLAASPAMRSVFEQVQRIARVNIPVLITGESGTGKEVIAKLLHHYSLRSSKRFLKVNCAAIPDELLESELFGYEAGAFTGATTSKPGYFEQCNHGTILLDEIGEMAPRLQAKLLQVLQDQRFFRLGGRNPVEVDVRVLAATNVNVKQAIAEGRLRLDLYYRLNALAVALPPLRERKEEIVPLFEQFMRRMARTYRQEARPLAPAMAESLLTYRWPGNLRELQNATKRYLILGEEALSTGCLPEPAAKSAVFHRETPVSGGTLKQLLREMKKKAEAEAIRNALGQTDGQRKEAAEMLGICYKALMYKSRQYGILAPSNRAKKRVRSAAVEEIAGRKKFEGPAVNVAGGRFAALKPRG